MIVFLVNALPVFLRQGKKETCVIFDFDQLGPGFLRFHARGQFDKLLHLGLKLSKYHVALSQRVQFSICSQWTVSCDEFPLKLQANLRQRHCLEATFLRDEIINQDDCRSSKLAAENRNGCCFMEIVGARESKNVSEKHVEVSFLAGCIT